MPRIPLVCGHLKAAALAGQDFGITHSHALCEHSLPGMLRIQQQDDWTRILPGFKGKPAGKESQEASL